MASGIMHMAIAVELIRRREFSDPDRLKFGSVLPDAGFKGSSHFRLALNGGKRTIDLDSFREKFGERMKADDLYLGYYLHLIQDICFRHFMYDKHQWNAGIPGNVDRLHRDYAIGNSYLIEKYRLCNNLSIPAGFDAEPLNELCRFDIKQLAESFESYFEPVEGGSIFFFTNEMADEYIAEAVGLCLDEIDAINRGGALMDCYACAW